MTLRTGAHSLLAVAVALAFSSAWQDAAQAQQTGSVEGIVLDAATNQVLGDAQVSIRGTDLVTLTNAQGRYVLTNVPAGEHTLQLELIGYSVVTRTFTVEAGATATVNLSAEPSAIALEELVVTGVSGGAVERAKVPFTVTSVNSADMPVAAVNPLTQLQGKVPGANIGSFSGRPGVAPAVLLRGPTSINAAGRSQEPLYIVDGVVLSSAAGSMNGSGTTADLNPADIEGIEIVKGAAASTLYGSRAANGVIQITTKRGSTDGVHFTARQEYGLNDIESDFGIARNHPYLLDETGTRFCVLDAYGTPGVCSRTLDYREEQLRINNVPGDFALTPASFPVDPGAVTSGDILRRAFNAGTWPGTTYNAVEQLVDPQPLSQSDLSMSGRIGSTTFFSSIGYAHQGGSIRALDGYERFSSRLNLGQRISDQWSIELNSFISRSSLDGENQEEGTGFFRLTRTPAVVDITQRDDLGRRFIRTNLAAGGVQNENPLYSFENTQREDVRWRYNIGGNVSYTPLYWFEADADFAIDRLNLNFRQFNNRGFRTTNSNDAVNNGEIFNGVDNVLALNGSAGFTVRPQLVESVASRFTFRWLYEQESTDERSLEGNFLQVSDVDAAENATNIEEIISAKTETQQTSYSAGGFFDVLDRYTFDLAIRRDGNSRFGEEHRWQTYWRTSAAWLMANEAWFPLRDAMNVFTLRGSLGTAGNYPRYTAQYETYDIEAGGLLSPQTLGNPLLRPEVVTELEVGLEMQLLERFGLSLTYANSLAKDQILPVPIPVAGGFPDQWQNAGELRNQTWEVSLDVPILRNPEGFSWTARANFAHNRTMVEKLNTAPFFLGTGEGDDLRIEEGVRYGTMYGRTFMKSCGQLPADFQSQCGGPTSAFQRNDEGWLVWVGEGNDPGMGVTNNLWNAQLPGSEAPYGVPMNWGMPILVRDTLTGTPLRLPVGNTLPDRRLSVGQTFEFRNFSLYALVEGVWGRSVWNEGRHWSYLDFLGHEIDQGGKSVETAKPIGYYYRASPVDGQTGLGGFYDILAPNNRTVEDASFIKLREVSASYRVGNVGGFGDWTISVIGRNLKTWTDYLGFDPEVGVVTGEGNDSGSGLINGVDAFTFPQLRTLSLVLSTSF